MPFTPVANTALCELVYLWNSQIVENTLWFEGASAWDVSSLTELATELRSWWTLNLKLLQFANCSLIAVKCGDQTSQNADAVDYTVGLPVAGTFAGTTGLPNGNTVTTAFRTGLRGRSYRGRNYFVGLSTGSLASPNAVTADFAQDISDAYDALSGAITVNTAVHVVVSRFTDGFPRANGVTTPVTNYTTDVTIDSQRRRLPGRGT